MIKELLLFPIRLKVVHILLGSLLSHVLPNWFSILLQIRSSIFWVDKASPQSILVKESFICQVEILVDSWVSSLCPLEEPPDHSVLPPVVSVNIIIVLSILELKYLLFQIVSEVFMELINQISIDKVVPLKLELIFKGYVVLILPIFEPFNFWIFF